MSFQILLSLVNPKDWLDEVIKAANAQEDSVIEIPLNTDGSEYRLCNLLEDQMAAAQYIMDGIRRYLSFPKHFKPIRMTLDGMAGCGKTVLVKTLVSLVRRMFQSQRAALICAPTGAAAFNAGGSTLHHMCSISANNVDQLQLTDEQKERLEQTFMDTIIIFFDERGMLDSKVVGKAERVIAQTTRGGLFHDRDWGGIPVIVFIGDDLQLNAVGKGSMLLPVGPKSDQWKGPLTAMEARGQQLMMKTGEDVMKLGTVKRQDESERDFVRVLNNLRHDRITDKDFAFLKQFHLDNGQFTPEEVRHITHGATFAFTTNVEVNEKNMAMLAKSSGPSNPIAKMKCQYPKSRKNDGKGVIKHFHGTRAPTISLLCVGAQVAICGRNFRPRWGLFNGAHGTVEEIVFAPGKDPNNGDLPEYVVVNFPGYVGPAWDRNNPKVSCAGLCIHNCFAPCR